MSKNPHSYRTKLIKRRKMKNLKMNYNAVEDINNKTTQPGLSICITSYQSGDVITQNIRSISNLEYEHEFCICDNMSKDDTVRKLEELKLQNIFCVSQKSSRGKGRNIAVSQAKYRDILIIDADVFFPNVERYYELFKRNYNNMALFIRGNNKGAWGLFISKELYEMLEGFPDLNSSEDIYFLNLCERLGILQVVNADNGELYSIEIRGMNSGSEARYSLNKVDQFKRYLIKYRDSLSVDRSFTKFIIPKIFDGQNLVINVILYVLALPFSFLNRTEPLVKKVKRVRIRLHSYSLPIKT